jgi:hypothetical protein
MGEPPLSDGRRPRHDDALTPTGFAPTAAEEPAHDPTFRTVSLSPKVRPGDWGVSSVYEGTSGVVAIQLDGATHKGVYKVEDGMLHVICHCGERTCHMNDVMIHPELLARHLLREIIEEHGGDSDA